MPFYFRPTVLFWATFSNFVLMALYVWADYGRGYLAEEVSVLNVLYRVLAFAYVGNSCLYLWCHQGELPWPSGFSMWSDWLSFTGNVAFAVTSCLYTLESSESITTLVLVVEASASLVNGASAICGFAGWWMEAHLDTVKGGCSAELWGLLTSLDAWAHITNFLPAVIYMGSSVAAAEINYARLSDLSDGAGAVRMPELLRDLARVYWYGDLLWTVNGLVWLVCWLRDEQYEGMEAEAEAEAQLEGKGSLGESLLGSSGGGSSSSSSSSINSEVAGFLENQLYSQATPGSPGVKVAATPTTSTAHKALRRRREKKLRDVEPYHLHIPFLRWYYALCGTREQYLGLRGSYMVAVQGAGSTGGRYTGSEPGISAGGSLNGSGLATPKSSASGGGSSSLSGKSIVRMLAVTSLAASAEAGGRVEMLEMKSRR